MACDKKDNAMADDMIRVTYRIECAGDVEAMAAKIASDQSTGTGQDSLFNAAKEGADAATTSSVYSSSSRNFSCRFFSRRRVSHGVTPCWQSVRIAHRGHRNRKALFRSYR